MNAAEENEVGILEVLLGRGYDMNAATRNGRTALSLAAAPSMGWATASFAVALLLSAQADVSAADTQGRTALHFATQEGRWDAVEMLQAHLQCQQ